MRTGLRCLARHYWPLSALLFGPWSAGLLLSLAVRLTAGSSAGASILAHYDTLRAILVSFCALYFVLGFMMWVVGKRPQAHDRAERRAAAASGFSTAQVLGWGLLGILLMPMVAALSVLPYQAYVVQALTHAFQLDPAMNAGFLWLVSLSTLIMTPIMVVWLVWMWRTWATHKAVLAEAERWDDEYE